MSTIEQTILQKVQTLPAEQQHEVLKFVETLVPATETAVVEEGKSEPRRMRIWEQIDEIIAQVPPEAWDEAPTDGSINVDHYLYGAPKRV